MPTRPSHFLPLLLLILVPVGCSPQVATDSSNSPKAEQAAEPVEPVESAQPATMGEASTNGAAEPAFYTVAHYDEQRDPAADLQATIERAGKEHKRILIQVGGDWCGWCKLMTKYMESNDVVRQLLNDHYLLMKVTYTSEQKNEAFLSQYPEIHGYPHLFVLEADGALLHSQDTAALEEGKGYSDEAFEAFLRTWVAQ